MSARVAPMEQAPAPAMLVPLDAPGDQRLALGLDLRADEVRCVALRQDGSIVAPAVTHRLENVALLGAVAALANAARAYVADVGRAWADVACVGVAPPGEVDDEVVTAPCFGWVAAPLRSALAEDLGVPTALARRPHSSKKEFYKAPSKKELNFRCTARDWRARNNAFFLHHIAPVAGR